MTKQDRHGARALPPSLPACQLGGGVGRLPLSTQVLYFKQLASCNLGQPASLPQGLGRLGTTWPLAATSRGDTSCRHLSFGVRHWSFLSLVRPPRTRLLSIASRGLWARSVSNHPCDCRRAGDGDLSPHSTRSSSRQECSLPAVTVQAEGVEGDGWRRAEEHLRHHQSGGRRELNAGPVVPRGDE